jgi:hypothetical protein
MLCSVCHIAASLAFAQMICAKIISPRLVCQTTLGERTIGAGDASM